MSKSLPVLTPERSVTLSTGQTVTVREMSWPKARLFLASFGELGQRLGDAFRPSGPDTTAAALGAAILGKLPDLIRESTALSESLVGGCVVELVTGRLVVTDLTASDFMRLLDASLEVTLNEDILGLGNAVAARVRGALVPAKPQTNSSPSGLTS
ncbi:MAG: hypothetical protein KIT22_09870 [Verrucomicrobiae bacterium]|nr:hypothetical protein [Verrucomicrobiae bacterium]